MGHSCPKYRSCVASLAPERDGDFGYVQGGVNSNHFSFRMGTLNLDHECGRPAAEVSTR